MDMGAEHYYELTTEQAEIWSWHHVFSCFNMFIPNHAAVTDFAEISLLLFVIKCVFNELISTIHCLPFPWTYKTVS